MRPGPARSDLANAALVVVPAAGVGEGANFKIALTTVFSPNYGVMSLA